MYHADNVSAGNYMHNIRLKYMQADSKLTFTPSSHQIHSNTEMLYDIIILILKRIFSASHGKTIFFQKKGVGLFDSPSFPLSKPVFYMKISSIPMKKEPEGGLFSYELFCSETHFDTEPKAGQLRSDLFNPFTFCFCRGRQQNIARIITHVHEH